VEQKNGMLVRRVVGYQRLEGLEAAQVLGELYGALRLFTNLFQPSFKLKNSERAGDRGDQAATPPAAHTFAAVTHHGPALPGLAGCAGQR
jgi:hypothetical protein